MFNQPFKNNISTPNLSNDYNFSNDEYNEDSNLIIDNTKGTNNKYNKNLSLVNKLKINKLIKKYKSENNLFSKFIEFLKQKDDNTLPMKEEVNDNLFQYEISNLGERRKIFIIN
jgi:hypothetical protein